MIKQICTRCVMDNVSDNTITFLDNGTCNYCNYAISRAKTIYFPNEHGKLILDSTIKNIKEIRKNKQYDCMMGLSGGLDSSYLAYLGAKQWGLRIYAIHIDDGFDSEIAKENIQNICKKCSIQLEIITPDAEQYMDLIKSFLRSGVPSIAMPQDNVLQAYLYKHAIKTSNKYFLSGANFALESILQRGNSHVAADSVHIKAIQKKFGDLRKINIPLINIFQRYIGQKFIHGIRTFRPLDLIEYNRDNAIGELKNETNFNYYGGKHYESIYTKLVQVYYLPKKFNIDKRKSHFSSMIISGQMTRNEALKLLDEPLYNQQQIDSDIEYILSKIGMSRNEFNDIISQKGKSHKDYKSSILVKFASIARKIRKTLDE